MTKLFICHFNLLLIVSLKQTQVFFINSFHIFCCFAVGYFINGNVNYTNSILFDDNYMWPYNPSDFLRQQQQKIIAENKNLFMFCISWGKFHQCSTSSFYACRSQKRKKCIQVVSLFLRFWDLHTQKLLIKCWWNWLLGSISPTYLRADFTRVVPKSVRVSKLSVSFYTFGICARKNCA